MTIEQIIAGSRETRDKLDHTLQAYGRLEMRNGEIRRENARLQSALQAIADEFCPGEKRQTYNADIALVMDRIRATAREALEPSGCPCVGTPDQEDCPHA